MNADGAPALGPWKVIREIPLPGDGGWDYQTVDSARGRLFVTHGDQVMVLDLKTDQVIASLPAARAHGVAIAPDLNRIFISNGSSGTITVVDRQTLRLLQTVPVGTGPDAVCYEARTRRIFAFNGGSGSASVLDAATGRLLGQVALPGRPEFAQGDGQGFVYDNIEDRDLVVKIDATQLEIVAQWSLPAGSRPSALAIDPPTHRLFVGCGNKSLYVLDSETGRAVAALTIGDGVDAVAYDPQEDRIFASCRDGTLTVIHPQAPDLYAIEQVVPTERGARTMAFESLSQTAYLPDAKFGPVPAPTQDHPHPRPATLPGTFKLLVVARAPDNGPGPAAPAARE